MSNCYISEKTHWSLSLYAIEEICLFKNNLNWISVEVKVVLLPTVTWLVCLGVRRPSATHSQIFNTIKQVPICWCEKPSVMWEWACSLQLLLVLTRAIIFYPSSKEHIQPWGLSSRIYIPQVHCGPFIPSGTGIFSPLSTLGLIVTFRHGRYRKHLFFQRSKHNCCSNCVTTAVLLLLFSGRCVAMGIYRNM